MGKMKDMWGLLRERAYKRFLNDGNAVIYTASLKRLHFKGRDLTLELELAREVRRVLIRESMTIESKIHQESQGQLL